MQVTSLHWDDENIEHIARHRVSPDEVEDVCFGEHLLIRGRHSRYLVYGQTSAGRYLLVVLDELRRGLYRPVTARELSESEKQTYRHRRG